MGYTDLEERLLVRVFIGEEDKTDDGKPLFKAIVEWCFENGVAGATVFQGVMGFGKHRKLRKAGILPTKKLPVVIEIVDTPQKVENEVIPYLKSAVREGLITVEKVYVLV
jgi:PII-like signaling protein